MSFYFFPANFDVLNIIGDTAKQSLLQVSHFLERGTGRGESEEVSHMVIIGKLGNYPFEIAKT